MNADRVVLLVLLAVLITGAARAAPAPLAKPRRGEPTTEQILEQLRRKGHYVREMLSVGPGKWEITFEAAVRPLSGLEGVRFERVVLVDGDDPRAALRAFAAERRPLVTPPPATPREFD